MSQFELAPLVLWYTELWNDGTAHAISSGWRHLPSHRTIKAASPWKSSMQVATHLFTSLKLSLRPKAGSSIRKTCTRRCSRDQRSERTSSLSLSPFARSELRSCSASQEPEPGRRSHWLNSCTQLPPCYQSFARLVRGTLSPRPDNELVAARGSICWRAFP